MVTAELLDQAQRGDEEAFAQLTGPYRRELEVHCYRILGSAADAEDALQETLLAAWQGLRGFERRASVRTWLYRIATTRCLNALRSARRRPQVDLTFPGASGVPEATRAGDVFWLEPYPDVLLEGMPDSRPGPEARYEAREAISLAFVTALQVLPPRQRAVLVLRDVLGFRASETASILDTTEESVTSALKRARATLEQRSQAPVPAPAPPEPGSAAEAEVVERLTRAFESGDVDGIVALLTGDAWLRMPPLPMEYQGRELVGRFFAAVAFRQGRVYRSVPVRANGQPALCIYRADQHDGLLRANGLVVLTLAGDRISEMIRFENSVLPRFGLPRTLPM